MASIATWVVCIGFWAVVSILTGAEEPWDAASFWTRIYPVALVLAFILGWMLKSSQWSAGSIVMFAQIPVVMVSSGVSPLLVAGVLYAALLSVPAMILSWAAGRIRHRYKRE